MKNKTFLIAPFLLLVMFTTACQESPTYVLQTAEPVQKPSIQPKVTRQPTKTLEATDEIEQLLIEQIQNILWEWVGWTDSTLAEPGDKPETDKYNLVLWEDNAFNFKADCNQGGGEYISEEDSLTIQPGATTLAECGPDSLSDEYIELLGRVESFELKGENLVLYLLDEAGSMEFENNGVADRGEVTKTCNSGIDPVSVTLETQGLPYAYLPECVSGTPFDDTQPPNPNGLPDHIQVTFTPQEETPLGVEPILYIIPVDAYKLLWDAAGDSTVSDSIDSLEEILNERSDPVPTENLPILPFEQVTGTSDLQVQADYLDISVGSGLRFITRFSQDSNPVSSDNPPLFYTYQGLSSSGDLLISFFYPVTTGSLPTSAEVTEEEQMRVDEDYAAYLEEKITELNALPASAWTPELDTLDALIASLTYAPPLDAPTTPSPRITGINWQWGEIIDDDPSTAPQVPNPQNYILELQPDGQLSYQSDCNSGAGSYIVRGELITIELEATTLADCGPNSLSGLYVDLLGKVQSYELVSNSLVFRLPDETDRMIFYNGGASLRPSTPGSGVPTGTTLEAVNVRSGPGTEYPTYGIVQKGTRFEVTGTSVDGDWWVVKIPVEVATNQQGWITEEYLQTTNTENVQVVQAPPLEILELPVPVQSAPTALIIQSVDVRSGPGVDYLSYGVAPIGSSAKLLGVSQDGLWWVIELPEDVAPDNQGWVPDRYVQTLNASTVPVITAPSR